MLRFSQRFSLDVNSLLLRIAGIIAIISIPFKRLADRIDSFLPFNPDIASHFISLTVGICLLYLAAQIARKKRYAFYFGCSALFALLSAELIHFRNPWQIALYTVVLISLLNSRKQYVVKSDLISLKRGFVIAASLLSVMVLFFVTSIEIIDQREFGKDLTTSETIQLTAQALVGEELPASVSPTRNDKLLISLLQFSGIMSAGILIVSLFQPLRQRWPAANSHVYAMTRILESHSESPEDFFKLWPRDKHYFFYKDTALAYKVAGNTAFVIDGISGKKVDRPMGRRTFLEFSRQNGWQVVVLHIDAEETKEWQQLGLRSLYIGSEAMIDVKEFMQSTLSDKHFRYIQNKATKEELVFELWNPPYTQDQMRHLQVISDAWLTRGKKEYTFIMGYFDPEYLQQCRVGVVLQNHHIVAYTNIIPSFLEHHASIDHMRSLPSAPSVTMHFLLARTIESLSQQHVEFFNLGLTPLSRLRERLDKNTSERMLAALKKIGSNFYSFSGLEQFKNKFRPHWQPRFIAYQGTPTRLPLIATRLTSATVFKTGSKKWSKVFAFGGAIIAGVTYASFPLAFVLNRPLFSQGLVSKLGESNQPYAWLFNSCDVISGLSALGVFIFAYSFNRPRNKLLRIALIAAMFASIGAVLAAIIPLPQSLSLENPLSIHAVFNPMVALHGISSFVNSGGFIVALGAWALHSYRQRQKNVLMLAIIAFTLASFGDLLGLLFPSVAGIIQRLFIICYSIWVVLFVHDILYSRSSTVQSVVQER